MVERQLTSNGTKQLIDKIRLREKQKTAEYISSENLRYLTKRSRKTIKELDKSKKTYKNKPKTNKTTPKKVTRKKRKTTPVKKKKTKSVNEVSYYALTKTGYYGFMSTLPLLIIYQVMAFYLNRTIITGARSGAEAWILGVFSLLGIAGFILLGCIGGGLIVYFYLQKKKKNIPDIKSFYFLMLLESIVYSFFFGAVVMRILKVVMPDVILQIGLPLSKWQAVMMSLGAGYFEELLFRVILYGGILTAILYTAKRIRPKKDLKVLKIFLIIVIGAITSLVFAFAHHINGEPFSVHAFWFRSISGMIFVILFQLRGFGVAAYTHAFYDLWIVMEAI